jgi:hypothetical protein
LRRSNAVDTGLPQRPSPSMIFICNFNRVDLIGHRYSAQLMRMFQENPTQHDAAPSFVERLKAHRTIKPSDPWTAALRKIRGQVGHDGVERIATETVLEQLGVPPVKRTPEAAKRLRHLMVELGWTPVRARAVTARGRAARVRGYARMRVSAEPRPHTIEP